MPISNPKNQNLINLAKFLAHIYSLRSSGEHKKIDEELFQKLDNHHKRKTLFVVLPSANANADGSFIDKAKVDKALELSLGNIPDYFFINNPKGNASGGHWNIIRGNHLTESSAERNSCQAYTVIEIFRGIFGSEAASLDKILISNKLEGGSLFTSEDKESIKSYINDKNIPNKSLSADVVRKFQEAIFLLDRVESDLTLSQTEGLKEIRRMGGQVPIECFDSTLERLGVFTIDSPALISACDSRLENEDQKVLNLQNKAIEVLQNPLANIDIGHEILLILKTLTYLDGNGYVAPEEKSAKKLNQNLLRDLRRYCNHEDVSYDDLINEARLVKKNYLELLPKIDIVINKDSPEFRVENSKISKEMFKDLGSNQVITYKVKDNFIHCFPKGGVGYLACLNQLMGIVGDNIEISDSQRENINRFIVRKGEANLGNFQRAFDLALLVSQKNDEKDVFYQPYTSPKFPIAANDKALNILNTHFYFDIKKEKSLQGIANRYSGEYRRVQNNVNEEVGNKLIHSQWSDQDMEKFSNPDKYSGIGAKADWIYIENENGQKGGKFIFTINGVLSGGPADKMGLGQGDKIEVLSDIGGNKRGLADSIHRIRSNGVFKNEEGKCVVNNIEESSYLFTSIIEKNKENNYVLSNLSSSQSKGQGR